MYKEKRTFKGEEKVDDLWGWGEGGAITLWLRVLNSFLRLFGQSCFLFVLIHNLFAHGAL